MNRCSIAGAILCTLFGLLSTSSLRGQPGVVKIRDGRTLEGDVTEQADSVVITIRGIATTVARRDVESIQLVGTVEQQYKEKLAALAKAPSAKGHVDIARWLFDHRSYELAAKEVAAALQIDPGEPEAAALDKSIQIQLRLEQTRPAAGGTSSTRPASATQPAKSPEERFADFQKAAGAGNGRAMGELGNCYASGIGTPKNGGLAFEWFQKGAKIGDRRSIRGVAFCLEHGLGTGVDLAKAFAGYDKAAKAGDPLAMESLGFCYSHAIGVPLDWARAINAYEKAAAAGNTHAAVMAASCYRIGLGELTVSAGSDMRVMVDPDVRKYQQRAVQFYTRAAEAGDAAGMMGLAGLSEEGRNGARPDPAKAAYWYKRAAAAYEKSAAAGDLDGMQNLGFCYEYGKGVAKDPAKAIEWYQKAVKGGDTGAMCSLGMCYACGTIVAKDEAMAVRLFEQAADAGDPVGIRCVGYCYKNGIGGPRNYAKALRWFRLGEKAGDGACVREIGVCHETGVGARRNLSTAIDCYVKGSMFGDAVAMYELGRCCARGVGVKTDLYAARSWISLSANAGYAPAKKALPDIQRAIANQQFQLVAEALDDLLNPPYDPDEAQRQQNGSAHMAGHRAKYGY